MRFLLDIQVELRDKQLNTGLEFREEVQARDINLSIVTTEMVTELRRSTTAHPMILWNLNIT